MRRSLNKLVRMLRSMLVVPPVPVYPSQLMSPMSQSIKLLELSRSDKGFDAIIWRIDAMYSRGRGREIHFPSNAVPRLEEVISRNSLFDLRKFFNAEFFDVIAVRDGNRFYLPSRANVFDFAREVKDL